MAIQQPKNFSALSTLPNPGGKNPWSQHTKVILKVAETMLEEEVCDAAFEVKKILRDVGDIEDCSDDKLKEKIVDASASFDGSWSSRGWTAHDGLVAAISVKSGNVVDVLYLSSTCNQWTKMEEKRKCGEILRHQFTEWYLSHDENCFMNYEGSSGVSLRIISIFVYPLSIALSTH